MYFVQNCTTGMLRVGTILFDVTCTSTVTLKLQYLDAMAGPYYSFKSEEEFSWIHPLVSGNAISVTSASITPSPQLTPEHCSGGF